MQSRADSVSVRAKMEELRLICDKEIQIQRQQMVSTVVSFRNSLQSTTAVAQGTVQNQVTLGKLKVNLRELDEDLVKALAVKTHKEAKRMAIRDSISSAEARIEELERKVQEERSRKDECAEILHQESLVAKFEEKSNQGIKRRGEIQEAISWYNRVLGFRIEGGHGVKFTFTNINMNDPMEEYSFTVRHENDIYTLMDCNPRLNGTKELIHELNRTNGLFKFVRIMRGKFQEAAVSGLRPQSTSIDQECSISLSAPVSSVSTDSRSESPSKQTEPLLQVEVSNKQSKRSHRRSIPPLQSPASVRKSPRKVKK